MSITDLKKEPMGSVNRRRGLLLLSLTATLLRSTACLLPHIDSECLGEEAIAVNLNDLRCKVRQEGQLSELDGKNRALDLELIQAESNIAVMRQER